MSLFKLIFRSISYYRKQHLAVLLGTVISTAILTGALIIGDSVKYSLSNLVEKRLGEVSFALETGDRFVSDSLAVKLAATLNLKTASVLQLQGISIEPESGERINNTQVLGVDQDFWNLSGVKVEEIAADEAIISSNIADRLKLTVGDEFLLRVEKVDFIPSNAPFVKEEEASVAFRLKVKAIADKDNLARFSLKNNQAAPFNVFLSKAFLSEQIEMSGYANTILVKDNEAATLTVDLLNDKLAELWSLDDAGLELKVLKKEELIELRSRRIFLEPAIANAVLQLSSNKTEVLSYLVNGIKSETGSTPYSFVSALSSLDSQLNDNEIIINDWLAEDLKVGIGDQITLDYYIIGPLRKLTEEVKSFTIKEIIKTASKAVGPSLMPPFPGLANANSCGDWETGVPVDLERIRDKDEAYWDTYKGTPKALVSYKSAKEFWSNRFGAHTAIRFSDSDHKIEDLKKEIRARIHPQELGLVFMPSREIGETAVKNSIGFGELFLSLSFFVIVAGILLTALLYSLSIESRKQEYGLFAAFGFTKSKILKIQFLESMMIAVLGGFIGAAVGILYNEALMAGINSLWIDIVRTHELKIYLKIETLLIGAFSGIFIALTIIYFVSRKKLRKPIVLLIKKVIELDDPKKRKSIWLKIIMFLSFGGILFLLFKAISGGVDAAIYMIISSLFLVTCFTALKIYLNHLKHKTKTSRLTTLALILRNISLNQARSMAVVILLALGAFTILITGANRKTFYGLEQNAQSGTGGYLFWLEFTLPILSDLNIKIENDQPSDFLNSKNIRFVQFHQLDGDDASCLNLNQVSQPQILGVNPEAFQEKQAFSFAKLHKDIKEDQAWSFLNQELSENVIPAYADQTVIQWGLLKTLGDTLYYLSEAGEKISMVLMGGLQPSVFQGNLIIGDQHFNKYFPSVGGSKVILVEADVEHEAAVKEYLLQDFTDYGIEINKASDRLAEFNSVTNTYLTVFMILGGLGVFIGTIGLGIVLLRNILDRRHEIALMQAIGFTKQRIFNLIFLENLVLLIAGMLIGLFAALFGMIPSLISNSFEMQSGFMIVIFMLVFINGLAWIYFTARSVMKSDMIDALKSE